MKVALITGGTSLLGEAVADKLLSDNFKVYLADIDSKRISLANVEKITLDVTDSESCEEAVRKIIKSDGHIDVLINIAGVTLAKPLLETDESEFKRLLDVNVLGHFRLSKLVAGYMLERKSGRIVNITSLNGIISLPNFGAYSASKFAAEAGGLSLRYELFGTGVWVTNVAPGAIERKINPSKALPHKPLREKVKFLQILLPFTKDREVADVVQKIIDNPNPPARVIVGRDAVLTSLVHKILPFSVWDRLIKLFWKKL